MRVRELEIENFRKFRQPVHLAGFDDGLNLVCEANEVGKSTVLDALRAALFERHGSRSERIQSFRPYGDEVAPTVRLTFEVAGEVWSVRKRFLQRPEVVLDGPRVRATGEEAEEKLQELLGFTRAANRGADADSRGALGLLWVEQGQSFVLDAPGGAARRTLETVLAGEVGAVTGGRRAAAVMTAVEKSLSDLLTAATGRPTRRLLAAQQAAEQAAAAAAEAQRELAQFEEVLARLEARRGEDRRLLRDLVNPDLELQIAALGADIERARMASQALEGAETHLREAVGVRERLEARAAKRAGLGNALAAAAKNRDAVLAMSADHAKALAAARDAERNAAAWLEVARGRLREAEELRRAAQLARTEGERRRILSAAFARLDAAEAIATELEVVRQALAAANMTEAVLDRLQKLEQAVIERRSAATAGAATLKVTLQPAAPAALLNGAAVEQGAQVAVTARQVLEIAGIGTVIVEPPAGGEAALAALRAAEQDLAGFLAQVGQPTAEEARMAARVRNRLEQTEQTLAGRLAAACPPDMALKTAAGLPALRGALAGEVRPDAGDSRKTALNPEDDAEARWEVARTAERTAQGRREAAVEALRTAELAQERLAGLVARANADHQRLQSDLDGELAALADDDLAEQLSQARASEARALLARDEARRAAAGLDEAALTRRRAGLVQKRERMREDRLGLVQEIARLEERARTLGGTGPATRATAAVEAADAARLACERLREEAEVLRLLKQVIGDAQLAASRRYLAPITRRVAPYVSRLLPNASLALGDEYTPRALIRGGREEAADGLSKGTQEQLAVLTRIAFADLLIEKGKPASLILDDALVFADDDRFETVLEVLADAARRMQVIILSCRTSAYRALNAKRIVIG
ncbi:MAG: AAA family ATPase [Enhydrobacter sp.]|nr:AAA family ATPase [Enhydrobacter sp.]